MAPLTAWPRLASGPDREAIEVPGWSIPRITSHQTQPGSGERRLSGAREGNSAGAALASASTVRQPPAKKLMLGRVPNSSTESQLLSPHGRAERHTCGVWSRQAMCVLTRLVRAVGPEWGRVRGRRRPCRLTSPREPGWSRCAACSDQWRGTVDLASVLAREDGQPACRVPGHTFVTPPVGVIMKPCGHDHDELNHLSRPHPWWGHAVPELRRGRARHHAASRARQRISPSRRP